VALRHRVQLSERSQVNSWLHFSQPQQPAAMAALTRINFVASARKLSPQAITY
jgi:hypothetical protein